MAKIPAGTGMSSTFQLKNKNLINYRVPPISSLFSNFLNLIHVEQLSASTMMQNKVQFMEILAHQNGLN